jgi:hypothetical protein
MTPGPQPTRGCYLDGGSPAYDACEVSTHHGRAGRLVDAKAVSSEDFPWVRFRLRSPVFIANGFLLSTGKRGALWSRNSVRNDIGGHPVTTPGSPPPVLARRLLDHWHRAKQILRQGSARGVHRAHNPWYQARMNSGSFGELHCVLEFAVLRTNRDARRLRTGDPAGRVRSP